MPNKTDLKTLVRTACELWRAEGHHGLTLPFMTWLVSKALNTKPDLKLYEQVLDTIQSISIKDEKYCYMAFECATIHTTVMYVAQDMYRTYEIQQTYLKPEDRGSFEKWATLSGYTLIGTSILYVGPKTHFHDRVVQGSHAVVSGLFSRRRTKAAGYNYDWAKPGINDYKFFRKLIATVEKDVKYGNLS